MSHGLYHEAWYGGSPSSIALITSSGNSYFTLEYDSLIPKSQLKTNCEQIYNQLRIIATECTELY